MKHYNRFILCASLILFPVLAILTSNLNLLLGWITAFSALAICRAIEEKGQVR